MNYRLLCMLCVVLSVAAYAQNQLSYAQLSIEPCDQVQTPLVPEDEYNAFNTQKTNQQNQGEHQLEISLKNNESNEPKEFSLTASLGQYTVQQMAAFIAGSLICGYGVYKAYQAFVAWYFPYSIQLTVKERDMLLTLTETMGQDVKQVRLGKRKPSLVKGLDMSSLGTPLDIECRYWQHNFVMLYNQCETNTETIDLLDAFYADFNQAIKDLISKAKIV